MVPCTATFIILSQLHTGLFVTQVLMYPPEDMPYTEFCPATFAARGMTANKRIANFDNILFMALN